MTHAAADALRGFALGNGESLLVALPLGGTSDEFPDRECLAGANHQSVDVFHRKCQVRCFVLLQLHVDVAQSPTNQRIVAIDHHGQRLRRPFSGELRLPQQVLNVALQDFLLHRQTISEGRYFAKQFSFHLFMDAFYFSLALLANSNSSRGR